MNLIISQGPHVRSKWTGQRIMMTVFLALIPAALSGILFFGKRAFYILGISMVSAWIIDIAIQILISRHKKKEKIFFRIVWLNWSSLLTGLFLGLILPPGIPIWLPIIGAGVSVALGKYAFGKGNNIFNPALIGRVFLTFAFPALMAGWIIPDAITSATPLTVLKENGYDELVTQFGSRDVMVGHLVLGDIGGSIGETSVIALLMGAALLICLGILNWKIPFTYISTVSLISFLAGRDVLLDLFAGGLVLGAFFMATDYVTSPITPKGKFIFALGCGILTMLFRTLSTSPEGVAFSILLMNATVPLIERYTKPIPLGGKGWGRCKTDG